jgi:hypothetical protein
MESTASKGILLRLAGRVLLGIVVGASFGVAIGALVASWVFGVEAIESEAVNASYVAAAITVFGALIGAVIGYRVGSGTDADDTPTG